MSVLLLIAFGLFVWYVFDTMQAKETALFQVKVYCTIKNIQILDDVVGGSKLRLKRNKSGQLQFLREFSFEFASIGETRYKGKAIMLGRILKEITVEPYAFED